MVSISVEDDHLIAHMEGLADQIATWRTSVKIPLEHVTGASLADASVVAELSAAEHKGPLPARAKELLAMDQDRAGVFTDPEGRSFWDVHNPDKAVVISLTGEKFSRMVLEVSDPQAAVSLVNSSLKPVVPAL